MTGTRTAKRSSSSARRLNSILVWPVPMAWPRGATSQRKARGWMIDQVQESAEATRLARKAVHLGRRSGSAMHGCICTRLHSPRIRRRDGFHGSRPGGQSKLGAGLELGAWIRVWRGEPDLALEHAARAMRLSPLDPSMYGTNGAMAYAHFLAGHYDMASSCAEKSMRDNPAFLLSLCVSAASNALAGRLEPAQRSITRALERIPICASPI